MTEGDPGEIHVPAGAGVAMSLCVVVVLALGLFPETIMQAAQHAASALF